MSAAVKPLNIYQRINEVRKNVAYIQKDKAVQGQGYKAVTHDLVTAMLRNHLIEFGVIVVPTLVESKTIHVGDTSKGNPIFRNEAIYDVAFVNMDSPDEKVVVRTEGHANDSGDKAPGKATSYATKYAMLKIFNIETGESEEARVEAYAERVTDEQAAAIRERLGKLPKDTQAGFMAWARVKSPEDIGQPAYANCISMLDKKIKEMSQENASE